MKSDGGAGNSVLEEQRGNGAWFGRGFSDWLSFEWIEGHGMEHQCNRRAMGFLARGCCNILKSFINLDDWLAGLP